MLVIQKTNNHKDTYLFQINTILNNAYKKKRIIEMIQNITYLLKDIVRY